MVVATFRNGGRRQRDGERAQKWPYESAAGAQRALDYAHPPIRLPRWRRPGILPERCVKPVEISACLHVAQHALKNGSPEAGLREVRSLEAGIGKVGTLEAGVGEIAGSKIGVTQDCSVETSSVQHGP